MHVESTITVPAASMTAAEHRSLAAQQMSRACGISLEEAEGWIDMAIRRATGVPE